MTSNIFPKLKFNNISIVNQKNEVTFKDIHLFGGNIDAFNNYTKVIIKLDEKWKLSMPLWKKLLATFFTWPFIIKYYGVREIFNIYNKNIK